MQTALVKCTHTLTYTGKRPEDLRRQLVLAEKARGSDFKPPGPAESRPIHLWPPVAQSVEAGKPRTLWPVN